jgi:hypothetical protein
MKKGNNPKPKELHSQGGTVPLVGQLDIPHSRVELMLSARYLLLKYIMTLIMNFQELERQGYPFEIRSHLRSIYIVDQK